MASTMGNLSAERQRLREELLKLEAAALKGRNRVAAINEANRRRKMSHYPPLPPTTVGNWFEKGTPAKDFEDLWALVEVLLEWSGHSRPHPLSATAHAKREWEDTRKLWKTRYGQAKKSSPSSAPPAGSNPALQGYLAAAQMTARSHSYSWGEGGPGESPVPDLTVVYVHQQATRQLPADHDGPSRENTTPEHSADGSARHAEEVFRTNSSITVLLAPAGTGKSTLLQTYRADSACRWLQDESDAPLPVLVNAGSLTCEIPLPAVLASAATRELTQFGLLDELTADLFRTLPRPKTPWLVLVDGLDEIPDTDGRHTVIRKLTSTAAAQPALYRFVVATRPLPNRELDALGPHAPRFQLQPFSPDDLQTYAANWFRDLDDPARHAQAFTAVLKRSRLDALARTPLMAFLLCRLYRANPNSPLPNGRTGVYQACVELLYETNTHKNITTAHDEAIRRLKDRHQIPRDNIAAEQAARQVREDLPELIDYLAHARLNGDTAPAVEILDSHLQVNRPQRLKEYLWRAFVGDLLRPTGLLTENGDDFSFLHQTFLEYHAARHATRDEQVRVQLLDELFPPGRQPRVPAPEPSYLGFLLDALLASPGGIAAETIRRMEDFTRLGRESACQLLLHLVGLRSNLPTAPTARQLTRFAQNKALSSLSRVNAAVVLARVDGYRETGADRLIALASEPTLDSYARLRAAEYLAEEDGYQEHTDQLYARLTHDATLDAYARVNAARKLAERDGYLEAGADTLLAFTDDTTLEGSARVQAAAVLTEVEGHLEAGADRLIAFADDTTLDRSARVDAAGDLAGMDGLQDAGADRLIAFADDTTLSGYDRVRAAEYLAKADRYRQPGADRLIVFANDTTLYSSNRIRAAESLARMNEYRDRAAQLYNRFADDTTLYSNDRVQAARALAGVEGWGDVGADRLITLANDTSLYSKDRVQAARELAWADAYENAGANRLIAFTNDTSLKGEDRVQAARELAWMNGYREAGADRLIALTDDTGLDISDRMQAARELAWVQGYQDVGADRLNAFADDTTPSGYERVLAAEHLAGVDGYQDRAIQLYTQFADDTTLGAHVRARAAGDLARMDGCGDAGAERLLHFANDTSLDRSARMQAAENVAEVDGYQEAGADHLIAFADNTALDSYDRLQAAENLAWVKGYREAGAERLIAFADNTALDSYDRLRAAESLARVEGCKDHATQLYTRLADDTTLTGYDRLQAIKYLAWVDGDHDRAAQRYASLADDTTISGMDRVHAAKELADVDGYQNAGAERLITFADDTTFYSRDRVHAAWDLAGVDGYRDAATDRLTAFAKGVDYYDRLQAAQYLAALRRSNAEADTGDVHHEAPNEPT
ncbi:NACHT domain-containing protein [Streptomyces sp. NPDC003832]